MREERGQVLIFVMVVMVLGALVVAPLLAYVNTSFRVIKSSQDNIATYYAADAGMEAVIADLLLGLDILSEDYEVPTVSLGGYDVNIEITLAENLAPPPSQAELYIDPGIAFGLDPLEADSVWEFEFVLPEGSEVKINWACLVGEKWWCDEHCLGQISLWKKGESEPLDSTEVVGDGSDEAVVNINLYVPGYDPDTGDLIIEGGNYIIKFANHSYWHCCSLWGSCTDTPKRSSAEPFSGIGDEDYTWVLIGRGYDGQLIAYQDYIITSTAGDTAITAYVRQTPGPSGWWLEQTVEILSWQVD